MRDREYDDEDARRDAIDERRARFNGCKCGNPDMPGSCPGWRNCPMHGEPAAEKQRLADVLGIPLQQAAE